ncbi:MAG: DegT/DnrJ/EryC1/StrS family aminotransferase [Alphaproteobacteria bacterium]
MTDPTLALLGGRPVRTRPFVVEPMVDEIEERLVLEAVREKNFSRYIGASAPDIETTLRLTSEEADLLTDSWHFLGGPHVRAFAAEFAAVFDVPYAIPVSSATVGLGVALAAAGVGPGDEVIVPAISYTASATAVLLFSAIPVFADVDPETFCLDPAAVEAAITPRTRAVMPVHLVGNLADMGRLRAIAAAYRLKIIEDAAQAIGAGWAGVKAGTLGDAGVFSFQQSKNIMTGEGGMIVTGDVELARRARLLINHGEVVFDRHHEPADLANALGFNFRMPELCAALGRAQLQKLDLVNEWRTRNAAVLREGLADIPGIRIPLDQAAAGNHVAPVPHLFVALYDRAAMGVPREVFVAALRAEGVPVGTGYVRPMYANPLFLKRTAFGVEGFPWSCRSEPPPRYEIGMCPVAERLLDEEFLWFYHIAYSSTEADMADIVAAVRKVAAARDALARLDPASLGGAGAKSQGRLLERGVAPAQVSGRGGGAS